MQAFTLRTMADFRADRDGSNYVAPTVMARQASAKRVVPPSAAGASPEPPKRPRADDGTDIPQSTAAN